MAGITIKVLFFGQLREQLDCSQWSEQVANGDTVAQLKQQLMALGDNWQPLAQEQVLCAVNQQLCGDDKELHDNDEVAFFPPVTGG